MKRSAALLTVAGMLLAASPVAAKERGGARGRPYANPSALIAAEIAFNRMAQEQGQWTAFRKSSAPEAILFVPEAVTAQAWLKGRADPVKSVVWQPHQAWISCDGSLGATRGAWQRADGAAGYFTTVWQRQKDGGYKWVMDQGDALAEPLAAPELIRAEVAACGAQPAAPPPLAEGEGPARGGQSADGTLAWQVRVRPDRRRDVTIRYWDGSRWQVPVAVLAGP